MSGPRVLMVIQRFRPVFTGHGIQVENLSRELVAQGARVEIATRRLPDAPDREEGEIPVNRFPMPVTRNPVQLWWGHRRLAHHIERGDYDIVHVHGAPAGLPHLLAAARRSGKRLVVTTTLLGADDPLSIRARGRLAAWRFKAYASADAYVAICPALAWTYPPAGIDEDRVAVIPVGVSVERFRPPADREAEADAVGWPRDVPRALFVGGVRHRKGVDVLLDAWERVLVELPEARLYVAGPLKFGREKFRDASDFVEACLARAQQPPLRDRVFFIGQQEDTAPLYRAAHLFVFPSRIEGFPNVLLESLASGLPAVAARIPGSTDVSVREGVTGHVVEQEDAAALAERTVRLLKDADRRATFSRASRAEAEERYAFPIVARAHLALYDRLLGGSGR